MGGADFPVALGMDHFLHVEKILHVAAMTEKGNGESFGLQQNLGPIPKERAQDERGDESQERIGLEGAHEGRLVPARLKIGVLARWQEGQFRF